MMSPAWRPRWPGRSSAEHTLVVAGEDDPVVISGCAVNDRASRVLGGEGLAGVGTGKTCSLGTPAAMMAAFSLSVRSLQTERVWTSVERTPTFLSSLQPAAVR